MIKLNLGCGLKKIEGYDNIDNNKIVTPDTVLDIVSEGLWLWADNSVDEVRAFDFLEHVPIGKTIFVIEEIYRVLKPDGIFEHFTPSTDGRGAFQDPTHVSFWNINSWFYYTILAWNIYNIKALFGIIKLEDIVTDAANKVIHTHGLMYAMKGANA